MRSEDSDCEERWRQRSWGVHAAQLITARRPPLPPQEVRYGSPLEVLFVKVFSIRMTAISIVPRRRFTRIGVGRWPTRRNLGVKDGDAACPSG